MMADPIVPLEIADTVDSIGSMIERVLDTNNEAELLGPDLHRLRAEHGLPRRMVVIGALLNDFARVAYCCIEADDQVSDDEIEHIYPIYFSLLSFLAKFRPEYERFVGIGQDELRGLLAFYSSDTGPFGAKAVRTQWAGLDVCRRTARETGDEEPLERYVRSQSRIMDRVFSLGGMTTEEKTARKELGAMIDLRRRLVETPLPGGPDPRIAAFCDPSGPPVFGAIAHANEVEERDPFDVDTVHAEAREGFERLVDRVLAPDADQRGRMLVLRGPSGAGKTHLMRAFRGYLHGHRRGFAAYMQLTTRAEDYARYVLVNVIDALERPYDAPELTNSGLITLSDALARDRRVIPAEVLAAFRDSDFDLLHTDPVSPLVDRILGHEAYQSFDPDLLRVLLYLQRREPPIRARVLKYLRCESLNDYDRRMLGGISPRLEQDAPMRMVEQLGRLMSQVGRFAFVLLIDQMEDVFNLEDSTGRIRQAVDVLRRVIEQVPTAVIVLSCLHDFYETIRRSLPQPALDRLESDPPPITLKSARSLTDIQRIVGLRLDYLYDKMGVRFRDDDPTFPIPTKELEPHVNRRTRDVLDWCREFQRGCMERGGLVDVPGVSSSEVSDVRSEAAQFGQVWNDFRVTFSPAVPEEDDALLELLAWASHRVGQEFEPPFCLTALREGSTLVVSGDERPLVVGIGNKAAQGGGLNRQLKALRELAGDRSVGLVRCSEFPSNPRTRVFKALGELLRDGGRRVTVENGDWRTIMAFQVFCEEHGDEPGFVNWCRNERPLGRISSLRELLNLDGLVLRMGKRTKPAPVNLIGKASAERRENVRLPEEPRDEVGEERGDDECPEAGPNGASDQISVGRTAGIKRDPVSVTLRKMLTHSGFLGSTGSGKTTLALNLIEQALERGVPVLLLDRKGDLCTYGRPKWWQEPGRDEVSTRRKRSLREKVEVAIYTPGEPRGRDLGFTIIPAGLSELEDQERAHVCRQAAAAMGTMLGYKRSSNEQARLGILAKAIEVLGEETDNEVRLEHVIGLIADRDHSLVNAVGRLDTRHFDKLVDNLETLRLTRGQLLSSRAEKLNPTRLLGLERQGGKVPLTIVSTKFLRDNQDIDFWVARMLLELARWANKNPSPELQAVVMFDEADIYMPATSKPATKEPLQDLLRRARAAGLGVMLATQSPGDLDYKSRENILTWFVGRVTEKTAVAKMQPLLSESRTNFKSKLANQAIGEFFMLQSGDATEVKAHRSLMDTEQLAEDEIRELARAGVEEAQRD